MPTKDSEDWIGCLIMVVPLGMMGYAAYQGAVAGYYQLVGSDQAMNAVSVLGWTLAGLLILWVGGMIVRSIILAARVPPHLLSGERTRVLTSGAGQFHCWEIDGRLYLISAADEALLRRLPKSAVLVCEVQARTIDDAGDIVAEQLGVEAPPSYRTAQATGKPARMPEL